jgi:hypothetical protein
MGIILEEAPKQVPKALFVVVEKIIASKMHNLGLVPPKLNIISFAVADIFRLRL